MSSNWNDAVPRQSITARDLYAHTSGRVLARQHAQDRNSFVVFSTDSGSGMTNRVATVFAVNAEQNEAVTTGQVSSHFGLGDWLCDSMTTDCLTRPVTQYLKRCDHDRVFPVLIWPEQLAVTDPDCDHSTTRLQHADSSKLWRNIVARLPDGPGEGSTAYREEGLRSESALPELKVLRTLTGKTKPIQRVGLHVELLD